MNKISIAIVCIAIGMSAAVGADVKAERGQPFEAVSAYMKDIDLMTIVAKYNSGDMESFKKSDGESFKKAIAAAGDKQKLADALKAVRAAEISYMDHVSLSTRAELDKAVGTAKVELELIE